jgi:hypothetical protein
MASKRNEAEDLCKENLKVEERVNGRLHEGLLDPMKVLASISIRRQWYAETESKIREILKLATEVQLADDSIIIDHRISLSRVLYKQQRMWMRKNKIGEPLDWSRESWHLRDKQGGVL